MKKRGIGYGCIFYGTGYGNGFPDVSVAEAELNSDGKINLYVAATECGQGSDTIMRQIAAESFGSDVKILNYYSTDTDITKDSGTAAASRQTYNTGNALRLASDKLKDRLIEKAKDLLNLNTTVGLSIENGEVFLNSYKATKISFAEIASSLGEEKLREEATFVAHSTEMDEETGQGCPYWPYTFGATAVEVEVDTETGQVEVVRAAAAQDVGRAINPDLVEGQMDGGFAMGYGFAVFEDLDIKEGKIRNDKLTNYLIPTAMDMPELEKIIIEDPEATGPYGAKGIGEPVMIHAAPAILNAIYDATGVRMTEVPVTPERLLKALKQAEVK
jgi:CO/xanthine dehydrogenase Mo-binding subunit